MITRTKPLTARVGVFGVGLDVYWEQFDGLLDKLMAYHDDFKNIVKNSNVEIIDFGMIDSNKKAYETLEEMKASRLDIIFCNMLTYATSSTFAPIIREINIPVILVGLQPLPKMVYSKANIEMQLENDSICAVPEFTGVAVRMGKEVNDVILGQLYNDEYVNREINNWCKIAKVLHDLKGARFGLMGHVLEAMYDMHSDPTAVAKAFGIHVPLLEVDEVIDLHNSVTEKEIKEKTKAIIELFDTPDPVADPLTTKLTEEDLNNAAKAAVALDKFVEKNDLTGLAYYYNGQPGTPHRDVVSSFIVGNSLLNAQGVPMCGEFDIKTCLAMFIMDRLEIGGSFAEFHPFDFDEDFILVGHDGPHHIAIADGKPVLRSLKKYHGKPGNGASVEFKIKTGPITMLCLSQIDGGRYKFIIGEGESCAGEIPATGNTNTRCKFAPNTRDYIRRWVLAGPTHHYALGIGHHADLIAKIAQALGIEFEILKG